MNFEQAKALRIQQWRDTLANDNFRMENPEAHRSCLLQCSADLAEEKLIDRIEQFDMDEMANAAYWHAVEELQSTPPLYRNSYHYDVVPRDGSPNLGTIRQSTFSESRQDRRARAYDGTVHRQGEELKLVYKDALTTGLIRGLVLTLDDGRQFDLVEKARAVNGVIYSPIDDPDVYRWLIDTVQVAQEQRNLMLMQKLRPFLELARFVRCLQCLDRFGKREDCAACNGLGFVEKPRCSSKLPEECQGQPNKRNDLGEEHVRRS